MAGALAAYEEALAIFRRLAEADKTNSEWQRDISVALDKIGYLKFQAKDDAGALAAYDESLAITRRLADADPGNVHLAARRRRRPQQARRREVLSRSATPKGRSRPMRRAWPSCAA